MLLLHRLETAECMAGKRMRLSAASSGFRRLSYSLVARKQIVVPVPGVWCEFRGGIDSKISMSM